MQHQKTPPPHETASTPTPPLMQRLFPIVVLLLVLSLGLHAWTLLTLHRTRVLARVQVATLAEQVRVAQDRVVTANIRIQHPVPIEQSIPIEQELDIPINTTIEIEEEVDLSLEGVNFTIPLELDVPVKTTVPIEIAQTVDISTTLDLDLAVPVSVPVRDTTLSNYLTRLERALLDLEQKLNEL